jgi:hypothetical protein
MLRMIERPSMITPGKRHRGVAIATMATLPKATPERICRGKGLA